MTTATGSDTSTAFEYLARKAEEAEARVAELEEQVAHLEAGTAPRSDTATDEEGHRHDSGRDGRRVAWNLTTGVTVSELYDKYKHKLTGGIAGYAREIEKFIARQRCTEVDDGNRNHDGDCTYNPDDAHDPGCLSDPRGDLDIGWVSPAIVRKEAADRRDTVRDKERTKIIQQRHAAAGEAGRQVTADELTVDESDLGLTGDGAASNVIAALRWLFDQAIADGLIAGNPAKHASKPRRNPEGRKRLSGRQVRQLIQWILIFSWDPILDLTLLWFHLETGARVSEALAVRVQDLSDSRHSILLGVKGGDKRHQPVSLDLIRWLRTFAASDLDYQHVFRTVYAGEVRPLSWAHYRGMWRRIRRALPWAAETDASNHSLRKTAGTAIARIAGQNVADEFLGHRGDTYVGATVDEVAAAVSLLLGYRHPLMDAPETATTEEAFDLFDVL